LKIHLFGSIIYHVIFNVKIIINQFPDQELGESVQLTRRNFVKLVSVLGASTFLTTYKVDVVRAFKENKDYWHIAWLNGAACTGCTISFAQTADPDILQVLTEILVGNSGLPVVLPDYMETIHLASGSLAEELKEKWKDGNEDRGAPEGGDASKSNRNVHWKVDDRRQGVL